jgi:hypothetical protein
MDEVLSIMKGWYHIPTMVTFTYMMLSPTKFFKKVDKHVFNEPDDTDVVLYRSQIETFAKGDSMNEIERDEKILDNLTHMVNNSSNPDAKRVWMVKKAEFERQLRWKRHTYYGV